MTVEYVSSGDLPLSTQPYRGRLVEPPTVTHKITDPVWRSIEQTTIRFALANHDHRYTQAFLDDPRRFRGGRVKFTRYDDDGSGFTLQKFAGQISRAQLDLGLLWIDATDVSLSVLETLIPKGLVTTADFPNAIDVGKCPPWIFGNVAKVKLLYVNHDPGASHFDYLVGRGTVTVTNAVRNFPGGITSLADIHFYECLNASNNPASSWADASRTDLYPGYTALRFIVAQTDYRSADHVLYADVNGLQAERNFARAGRTVFSDATHGLGLAVNATSFAAAEAILTSIGGLYCDGAITEQVQAQDVLKELFMVRGMLPRVNAEGEFTLTVDTHRDSPMLVLGTGPGVGPRNFIPTGPRSPLSSDRMVKNLVLKYRRDLLEGADGTLLFSQTREVSEDGNDKTIECNFIRDHTTADKVADYNGKRLLWASETVPGTLLQDARSLVEGDLVELTCPQLGYASGLLEIAEIGDALTEIPVVLQGGDPDLYDSIYVYDAGTLPADNVTGTSTDYSRTDPSPASALVVASSSVERATNGQDTAVFNLTYTTPTTNITDSVVGYRKTGTTTWTWLGPSTTTGVGVPAKVTGAVPGQLYDFTVSVRNTAFGRVSSGDPTSLSNLAPGDTTAPATPTGLAVQNQTFTAVTFVWTAPADKDVRGYNWDLRTAANGGGSVVRSNYTEGTTLTISAAEVGYGTARHFRVQPLDITGNVGSFTSSTPVTFTQVLNPDIGPEAVSTPKVAPNAIVQGVTASASNDVKTKSSTEGLMPDMSASRVFEGGPVYVDFSANTLFQNESNAGSDNFTGIARLYRDTTLLKQVGIGLQVGASGGITLPLSLTKWDVPPAGPHTYRMTWFMIYLGGTSQTAFHVISRDLTAVEYKR